ncbi:inhibin alpha chain isoform X1 [Hypanus sabinus]|uniref:inhibin alpha chain isoform X1 n=1 Tax=Hypanus sabinus TaxID=79690 RepID=UPI0028C3C64A|nr:inhibin alpha chain isoform X1 [Hypanus sabinus]
MYVSRLPAAPLPLVLLLLLLQVPGLGGSCSTQSPSEDAILAKVRDKILQSLGLAEAPRTCNQTRLDAPKPFSHPGLERHLNQWATQQKPNKDDDTSEVISFPITSVPCDMKLEGFASGHSYIFQLSMHPHRHLVTSAELWFYTRISLFAPVAREQRLAELYFLVEGSFVRVPGMVEVKGSWVVFHISESFLPYVMHNVLVLQIRCPTCQCVADQSKLPFILSTIKSARPGRSRRSSVPWSLAYVNLVQRSLRPELIRDDCQRSAINITFEELGWGNWIVHPRSFIFYYCNGTCTNSNRLASSPGLSLCCTSVPGTLKPLRVRTTSDNGFTFKYETIPNIITRECGCI